MRKFQIISKLGITAFFTVLLFHNCTGSAPVIFGDSASKVEVNLESNQSGGEPFLGKPREGDYTRTLPDYQCGSSANVQGQLSVSSVINISKDNCRDVNFDFNLADKLLEYSEYNKDFLGVGTAMYEIVDSSRQELPATELWCRQQNGPDGFDIVVKVSADLTAAQAKFYIGKLGSNLNVAPFSVQRAQNGNAINYSSKSLQLNLTIPPDSSQFGSATALTKVDGIDYNLNMNCRVANRAPIEEMGTGLTQMFVLNTFTTDSQEALCAHPGVLACENWESRPASSIGSTPTFGGHYKLNFYALGPNNNAAVNDLPNSAVDGTKFIQFQYNQDTIGPTSADFDFALSSEVFARFYMKFSSNFVLSPVQTSFVSTNGFFIYLDPNGLPKMNNTTNATTVASTAGPLQNRDQWHCIELHGRVGTTDGEMELWIDDIKHISMKNTATPTYFNFLKHWTRWSCIGGDDDSTGRCVDPNNPANRHPDQSIYFDNYIVAKQRIGCF